ELEIRLGELAQLGEAPRDVEPGVRARDRGVRRPELLERERVTLALEEGRALLEQLLRLLDRGRRRGRGGVVRARRGVWEHAQAQTEGRTEGQRTEPGSRS